MASALAWAPTGLLLPEEAGLRLGSWALVQSITVHPDPQPITPGLASAPPLPCTPCPVCWGSPEPPCSQAPEAKEMETLVQPQNTNIDHSAFQTSAVFKVFLFLF